MLCKSVARTIQVITVINFTGTSMHIHILKNLLNSEQLAKARGMLIQAKWGSGHLSGGNEENKRNTELAPECPVYIDLLRLVESSLRESLDFQVHAWPRYMTRPIISRYEEGMFYKEHTDFPVANFLHSAASPAHRGLAPVGTNYVRTDMSITLFLSDPDSYNGGELTFSNAGEVQRYKLPAGSAILYPTGVPHSVSMVTRGIRTAAIFWVQSMFPNESQRLAVTQAYHLHNSVEQALPGSPQAQQAEVNFHNVFRLFAEV